MRSPQLATILLAAHLVSQICVIPVDGFGCHTGCHCIWRHGKMTATCTELQLVTLPTDLDEGLQVLNMSMNSLKALQNNQVANAGLLNLQKLYLSLNQLRELQKNAFYKMNNLVELDLSFNKLGAVPTNAFKHLGNLRQLLLKGNPITILEDFSFSHLRSLSVLELSSCKIETVARDALSQLESLQVLKLDDNLISYIEAYTLLPLVKLHGISLDGNAWNCDCRLRPFRDWLAQNHPTSYSPTCHLPETIRDLSWNKVPEAAFSCSPNFTLNAQEYRVQAGSNLTLHCEAWGTPPPRIQWYNGDLEQDGTVVRVNDSLTTSQLILNDLNPLYGATYTCRATNSAGSAQLNFTVLVVSEAHETHMAPTTTKGGIRVTDVQSYYSGNAGLIGLVLSITTACLAVLSVIVLLLWSCRRNTVGVKRKTSGANIALGTAEVESLKAAEAAEDIPPQKPSRTRADYECLIPAALDLEATLRTSSLYSSNPYCCKNRRSLASSGPIPVPMPLLPACATLPRDRRPLSRSPADLAGQTPPELHTLRSLNLMDNNDSRSDHRTVDSTMITQYREPDVVRIQSTAANIAEEYQECSISQSSSSAPLLGSPDLLIDQGDQPSTYFRPSSVLSTVPEAHESAILDRTQV